MKTPLGYVRKHYVISKRTATVASARSSLYISAATERNRERGRRKRERETERERERVYATKGVGGYFVGSLR